MSCRGEGNNSTTDADPEDETDNRDVPNFLPPFGDNLGATGVSSVSETDSTINVAELVPLPSTRSASQTLQTNNEYQCEYGASNYSLSENESSSWSNEHANIPCQSFPNTFWIAKQEVYRCLFCSYSHHGPLGDTLNRSVVCPFCFQGDLVGEQEMPVSETHSQGTGVHEGSRSQPSQNHSKETNSLIHVSAQEENEDERYPLGETNHLYPPALPGTDDQSTTEVHTENRIAEIQLQRLLQRCRIDSNNIPTTNDEDETATAAGAREALPSKETPSLDPSGTAIVSNPRLCSLLCQIIVFQRGSGMSLRLLKFITYIIPAENDFDRLFRTIMRDECNIYQSHVTCSFRAIVLEYLTMAVSVICSKNSLILANQSRQIVSQEFILRQANLRLIQGAIEFAINRDSNSHGWSNGKVEILIGSRGTPDIRETFSITSYHEMEDILEESTLSMPQEDRDTIRTCFVRLLDQIHKVDKVLKKLYNHDILEEDDVERIQNRFRNRQDQIRYLLLLIQLRGNVLGPFIDVLQSIRGNEHAAKTLCEEKKRILRGENRQREPSPMSDGDKSVIRHCYVELIQCIQNENRVLAECYSHWIVDDDEIEEIAGLETRKDRIKAILDRVVRSAGSLSNFIDILSSVRGNRVGIELLRRNSR